MKYFKLFEQLNDDVFNKIRADYFLSPVIDFSYKQRNGYIIIDNKVMFGTMMTYEPDVEYLLHEMGHFVLFKDYNRLLLNSYGLHYPQVEVNGEMYDIAFNWNDIKNEVRAVIFQYILAKKYNIDLDLDGWIRSLKLLDGFIHVPVDGAEKKELKWYDNDNNIEVPYNNYESRKIETIKKFFQEEIKKDKYNIEYFNTEWFKRVEFLESKLKSVN
jgi:hypothetical protein